MGKTSWVNVLHSLGLQYCWRVYIWGWNDWRKMKSNFISVLTFWYLSALFHLDGKSSLGKHDTLWFPSFSSCAFAIHGATTTTCINNLAFRISEMQCFDAMKFDLAFTMLQSYVYYIWEVFVLLIKQATTALNIFFCINSFVHLYTCNHWI